MDKAERVDWSRFSHLSLSDFRGLVSRRTVILTLMAVILYHVTGIFYKAMTLQLIRMRPSQAMEMAQTMAAPIREPADAYRVIPERNLFGTTTKAVANNQASAVHQQQNIALLIDLKGTVAGATKYWFAIIEEKRTRKQRLVTERSLSGSPQSIPQYIEAPPNIEAKRIISYFSADLSYKPNCSLLMDESKLMIFPIVGKQFAISDPIILVIIRMKVLFEKRMELFQGKRIAEIAAKLFR